MSISMLAPAVQASLLRKWEPVNRTQLHYLITWSTRGRRPALRERHATELESSLRRLCEERAISLLEVCTGPDHVHVLLALKATHSVSSVVRLLGHHRDVTHREVSRTARVASEQLAVG